MQTSGYFVQYVLILLYLPFKVEASLCNAYFNIVSNYRPISFLSVVGKLFERIIHKYIHNFLLDNDLFYKYQSRFLPNNSTVYQLLEIYHSIVTGREEKKITSALQGSANVHRGALLVVPQWQCISSFVFYIVLFSVMFPRPLIAFDTKAYLSN